MRAFKFALALLPVCMATTATHAAVTVAESTMTISNLGYQLIDLDPDDGITPWIQFSPTSVLALVATERYDVPSVNEIIVTPGDLFSAPDAMITSANGYAFTSSSLSEKVSSVKLNDTDFQNGQIPNGFSGMRDAYGSGSDSESPLPFPVEGDFSFTLSPNTAIVVDATVDIHSSVDAATLQNSAFGDYWAQQGLYSGYISTESYVIFNFSPGDYIGQEIWNANSYIVDGVNVDLVSGEQWGVAESQITELVKISFYNASSDIVGGEFTLESVTSVYGSIGSVVVDDTEPPAEAVTENPGGTPVPPVVIAVPEPSTYALMLLGLGGLATAVRRQRLNRFTALINN